MNGNHPQQQVPHRPAISYLLGSFPLPTTGNPHVRPFRNEENGYSAGHPIPQPPTYMPPGSTPACSHSPHTLSHQHNPSVELRNQWSGLRRREGLLHRIDLRSHSTAGHNQGLPHAAMPPEAVRDHSYDHVLEHWGHINQQPVLESPEPISPMHGDFNASASSHETLPFNNHASTSDGGGYESRLQVANGFVISRPLRPNDPESGSYSTTNDATPISESTLWEAGRDYRNPYARARSYRRRQHLGGTPTFPELSGGTTDALEYTEPLYHHSLGGEGIGDGGRLVALLPNLHSDGMPGQPTGLELSRKNRKTEQVTSQDEFGQKRTLKRKPADFSDSTKQFPATPVVTRGPTHLIIVPQTWYRTTTRQEDWEKEPPIEFLGIKLTDAVNKTWIGTHDQDERVLNYEGVGSSILCRLHFSGREIGRRKITTTNHKSPPEAITKKKLAFEVAKLVKRYIKNIKDEPGCADIAFKNLVLMRLFHVSKASWQPELWYEVPAPRAGLS